MSEGAIDAIWQSENVGVVVIRGDKKHSARLRKMASQSAMAVTRGLYAAGQLIELEAEHSITAGSISGRGHVPSAPGSPPNRDTGLLDSSIETYVAAQNPPTVHVESKAPYAAALEYGTSKMAERPYMRPAVAKTRGQVAELVRDAVKITIR